MMEMKDAAFLCRSATSGSLILVDELGRATSNEDGLAIAWSVAEWLAGKGAVTFFVSHYPQLSTMSDVNSCVQNQHMDADINDDGIRYTHKVGPGACPASSKYGIEMSQSCGWPVNVVRLVSIGVASFICFSVHKCVCVCVCVCVHVLRVQQKLGHSDETIRSWSSVVSLWS